MRFKPSVLTHGGAGSDPAFSDGCDRAARAALENLEAGGDAFSAALAATVILEDDPRFNAGTGANLRMDGKTIQLDAAIMTSDGQFGGVACLERVRNPILVAARVRETPHLLLVGEGATRFARKLGFPDYDPLTPGAKERFIADGATRDGPAPSSRGFSAKDIAPFWNFDDGPTDTVGAVVRDAHGAFAATASTGGTRYTLLGRVGDSPLLGAGIYAGTCGAVACTGLGEEITRHLLAKSTYDLVAAGASALEAAHEAVARYAVEVPIGVLVLSRTEAASHANRPMAHGVAQP